MRRARDAELIESFGLTPEQIGRLTERQVMEYYFHPREKDSRQIKHPEPRGAAGPAGLEQHLTAYLMEVRSARRRDPRAFPEAAVLATVAQIRAYWAKKEAGDG